MILNELKPRRALNKAFLKVKPNRTEIEGFKTNLIALLDRTNDTESEEFHKNLVIDFLKRTYYDPNHFINTKGRNDLVIHNGQNASSSVGVILEAKKPTNKAEMISTNKLNTKAFQELVLYYLRERITHKNLEVKHLVATNINEWFIFDATLFDRLFAQNKNLVKQFNDFESGRLSDTKTDFFYKQIAEPFISSITSEIEFTYFNIQDFQKPLRNTDKADDNSLIALFKLLSPEHLLKLPFTNDSNSLDKRFYSELLHIIGLTETKEGSKKLIDRNKAGERHTGTILEDAIIQLDSLDKLSRFEKPNQFGNTQQERLFNLALELSITWINRILFLKLLEAQLITYHKGNKSYSFLSLDKIKNYDDLNSLFFQVLARKYDERNEDVKKAFEKTPYLNSSLFEPTDIEQVTLTISNLKDDKTIPIFSQTVLKDQQGKKRTGNISTLQYLFEFLDAYDFGAEGGEEIQENNKTLINASVLGLIFEKINGYKDGSFFTPGFITMYMCRETIRKAVVQKFNETKKWNCTTLEELYDNIEDRKEANQIVNSIKICDPAVGSGHFLVSALNEIIAVKNDLKILQDRDGKRLKEYQVEVVNDELVVTDEESKLFEYNPGNKESQRIQETLFHEKQTIIENCLFGVDINSNSVKICRLRLWIELLKNAYYKNATELETLPNIDINIKCGNSLMSRFAIDADLKQALKKSKWTIDDYRTAVETYRNAKSKEHKREMERLISDIKSDFRSEIDTPFKRTIRGARGKAEKLATKIFNLKAFGEKLDKKLIDDHKKAVAKFRKLEEQRDNIESNKIFENAFEWRFEFPEVLNNDGDFVGFDVVIGNPPYVNAIELKKSLEKNEYNFYKNTYSTAKGSVDLYIYFFELGYLILRDNSFLNYITPNRFLSASYGFALREFLLNKTSILNIGDYSNVKVFKEASTYPITTLFKKSPNHHNLKSFTFVDEHQPIKYRTYRTEDLFSLNDFILGFVLSEKYEIVSKIISQSVPLGKCGIINATSTAKEADDFNAHINESEGFKLINTGTIDKFSNTWGLSHLVDKKKKYLTPYLPKSAVVLGKNRFDLYSRPKIIFAKIAVSPEAFYDEKGEYASVNTNCIHSFTDEYFPEFILGWVNSRLFQYLFECFFDGLKMSGGYLLYSSPNLLNTYIKKATQKEQEKIVSEVRKVIEAYSKNETQQIEEIEHNINQLFYQLYELTEYEIKIIEKTKPNGQKQNP
ncbi:type II restriction endonuclease [Pelobium manganitolerans]|uniref:site-specific DNA-methyltransferase (adenine-specific) n=1 Tax=Pelobium manganitolerans TaxID=1842495 RepID=A0A419S1W6_9SPHI|nr:Eco57I restriction-modification methylase domain-containing protein [Pelobium manganitolerans]RKD12488.1 type II restriction endonuclease [Pelobium manganitolerans]